MAYFFGEHKGWNIELRRQCGRVMHQTRVKHPSTASGLARQLCGDEYMVVNGINLTKEEAELYFESKLVTPDLDLLGKYSKAYIEEITEKIEGGKA